MAGFLFVGRKEEAVFRVYSFRYEKEFFSFISEKITEI